MSGPVPKREDERRRRNESDIPMQHGLSIEAEQPEGDPTWHPIALEWFESLGQSGQASWYQASDWATAKVAAKLLSDEFSKGKGVNGQVIAVWSALNTELLGSEGARRRARVELSRPKSDEARDAAVLSMDAARVRLGAV